MNIPKAFFSAPALLSSKPFLRRVMAIALLMLGNSAAVAQAVSQHSVLVKGPANFRDISLHTWKGIPRLGVPDSKGLVGPVFSGAEVRVALQKNEALARQLGESLERHNYSLGLLAVLDYMRLNADCFTGLNQYQSRKERCGDTLIQHNAQLEPWKDYVRNLALSLSPQAHGKLFCQHAEGQPVCAARGIDQVSVKGPNGRPVRLDEFQRRDFFNTLMGEHQGNFEQLWRNSRLPEEAWFVELVRLSEYDFDKEHYVFNVSPANGFINQQFPRPQTVQPKKGYGHKGGPLNARLFALSPQYTATESFEQGVFVNGRTMQVTLPMNPAQARALGQSSKTRTFYAVTKIRFLPREKPNAWKPSAGANKLAFHYAQNRVELYRDSSLTQKVAEVPLTRVATATAGGSGSKASWQWAQGHRIFDSRAYAMLRLKAGDLADDKLQTLANAVAQGERRIWMNYERRLQELDRLAAMPETEAQQQAIADRKRLAEDRTKLSHLNWQQMDGSRKNTLYQFMLAGGDNEHTWPDAFPSVPWGLNAATIFPKGHFSTDPVLAHIPATEQDKAILRQFLREIVQTYPTDKLTLVFDLRDTRYDNQSKVLKFDRGWPFHLRSYITFDDDRSQQYTSAPLLVNAGAKDRAIYPLTTSSAPLGEHVPDPRVAACRRNEQRQSEDCVTTYGHFLQPNWGPASLALDRELAAPELTMDPVRGTRLMNSKKRQGPGWRLVVELDGVDMRLSPYEYKPRNKRESVRGEAQTIFASVKQAFILAPNDETVWQASSAELEKPVDGSKLVAEQASDFTWPSPVTLLDGGGADSALYDFLFAKHYPERVDQRFLEAMFSSRWGYEKSASAPSGGRFFNRDARTPTWQDLQNSLPRFKQWLLQRASQLPDSLKVLIPVRYANDTMREYSQCARLKLTPNSPLRNSGGAKALAAGKVRQCQTSENQAKSQYQRCESLRRDLSNAQTSLAKAQQAGCKQTLEENAQEGAAVSATGACDFSHVDFSNMQQAVQACMAERCGPTPTTMANMAEFQQCVQGVSGQMQEQLRAAMGGGLTKPREPSRNRVVDNCKPHRQVIRNTESGLKSFRCDDHLEAPVPMNCAVLGEVAKPSHMHVERLVFGNCGDPSYARKSNASAQLLPNAQPYSDTHLQLEIGVGKLELPYDPPNAADTPSNAVVELDLEVQSVEAGNRKTTMKLQSVVRRSAVRPAK